MIIIIEEKSIGMVTRKNTEIEAQGGEYPFPHQFRVSNAITKNCTKLSIIFASIF